MPHLSGQNHAKPLTDEIKDAEWQVIKRQQLIDVRAHTLARKIKQQMTEPVSLMLAGGIGFIIGELTKRQPSKARVTVVKERRTETASPLKAAMNLFTSLQTLYTALPLAWFMKSLHRSSAAVQASETPRQKPISKAILNRRRYNRRKPLNIPSDITFH